MMTNRVRLRSLSLLLFERTDNHRQRFCLESSKCQFVGECFVVRLRQQFLIRFLLSELCPEGQHHRRPIFWQERRGDDVGLGHCVDLVFSF